MLCFHISDPFVAVTIESGRQVLGIEAIISTCVSYLMIPWEFVRYLNY